MENLGLALTALLNGVRRAARRPTPSTRYRCDVCGARVGQRCVDPFCYGSLGDPPRTTTLPGRHHNS
jgi:hypothetical protein